MKDSPNRRLILLFISVFISLMIMILGLEAQETVTLYLEPDTSGYVVDTIPAEDPRLESAAPMSSNGDQSITWKMFELEDTFEGYVEKAGLTKGLTVTAGAMVYFVPEKDGAFLTILEEGNQAQVLLVENEWAKISVPASLPVYFQSEAPQEVAEASPEEVEEQVLANPSSENLTPPATASGLPLDRKLEGHLRRIPQSGLFSKPKYNWELVDSRDRRIAYVDPKDLILPGRPLESMVGRRVIVSGTLSQLDDGRNMIIVARQIVAQ